MKNEPIHTLPQSRETVPLNIGLTQSCESGHFLYGSDLSNRLAQDSCY
jgi:hypothetical protein